jgi:hypothetical protein
MLGMGEGRDGRSEGKADDSFRRREADGVSKIGITKLSGTKEAGKTEKNMDSVTDYTVPVLVTPVGGRMIRYTFFFFFFCSGLCI